MKDKEMRRNQIDQLKSKITNLKLNIQEEKAQFNE